MTTALGESNVACVQEKYPPGFLRPFLALLRFLPTSQRNGKLLQVREARLRGVCPPCFPRPAAACVPMILDEFQFLTKLGEGAFATVWAARKVGGVDGDGDGKSSHSNNTSSNSSSSSEKLYAVKHLKQAVDPTTGEDTLSTPEFRSLRAIPRHVHVLRPVQVARENGQVFLVTEWCDTDLLKVLDGAKANGARGLPEQTVRSALFGLLSALAHTHANGWSHRDVKPENILIQNGNVKLADFGEASELSSLSNRATYVGTRWYRAPEQFLAPGPTTQQSGNCVNATGACDVWAAGCVMGECLTGRALFRGTGGGDMLRKIAETVGGDGFGEIADCESVQLLWHKASGGHVPTGKGRFGETFGSGRSPTCLSLLRELLNIDPSRRISAGDALRHAFFSGNHEDAGVFVPKASTGFTRTSGTSTSATGTTGTTITGTTSTGNNIPTVLAAGTTLITKTSGTGAAASARAADALRRRRAAADDSSSSDDEFAFDESIQIVKAPTQSASALDRGTENSMMTRTHSNPAATTSSSRLSIPREPTPEALAAMREIRALAAAGTEGVFADTKAPSGAVVDELMTQGQQSVPIVAAPITKNCRDPFVTKKETTVARVTTQVRVARLADSSDSDDDEFRDAPRRPERGGGRAGARAGRRLLG